MNNITIVLASMTLFGFAWTGCKTVETGGKVVDKSRNEVVISAATAGMTALPEGKQDQNFTKARQRLEKQVSENPKDVKSIVNLAQLQLAQDRITDAEDSARRALLLDTKNQVARKVLAQSAIRRENYDLALIFLSALGGEESKDSDVFNMLGIIALSRGENDDAMRIWKSALAVNPGDISVRMNMGVMYLKNRLFAQAQTQFERILKIAPNHQDARLHMAIIDTTKGRNAEAVEAFQSILAEDKNNPLVLFNLAVAQKNLANYEDSMDSLKKYIKSSPSKSKETDQAFAMIEEINTIQSANNQKVSDDEVQSLARELANRSTNKKDQAIRSDSDEEDQRTSQDTTEKPLVSEEGENGGKARQKKAADATAAQEKLKEPSADDSEIEALEKQLKAPTH